MGLEGIKLELIEWVINLENEVTLKALKEIKDSNLRIDLGKKLKKESKLTATESLSVLSEFAKPEDRDQAKMPENS